MDLADSVVEIEENLPEPFIAPITNIEINPNVIIIDGP